MKGPGTWWEELQKRRAGPAHKKEVMGAREREVGVAAITLRVALTISKRREVRMAPTTEALPSPLSSRTAPSAAWSSKLCHAT